MTRAGAIVTAMNAQEGWRSELAAASMYDGRTIGGAAMKALRYTAMVLAHPKTLPGIGLVIFAVLAALVVGSLALAILRDDATSTRPVLLRILAAGAVLAFAGAACSPAGDTVSARSRSALLTGGTTSGPALGRYFYHRNHVNSSAVVSDASGVEAARMVHVPFGEIAQANSSGADVVTRKFTGQELDEELGLYNYGARYYDPAIGRFVSADSLVPSPTDAQSFNRYTYVRDNPIVYVDPTGHFMEFIGSALNWIDQKMAAVVDSKVMRSVGKVFEYARAMVKAAARDPKTAISFGIAVATGNPILWLQATLAAMAAVSIAMAAGITNPIALSLIAAAAGAIAGGVRTPRGFLRAGLSFGGARAIGSMPGVGSNEAVAFAGPMVASAIVNDAVPEAAATGGGDVTAEASSPPAASPGDFMRKESEAYDAPVDTTYGAARCSFAMSAYRVTCIDIRTGEVFLDTSGYAGAPGYVNDGSATHVAFKGPLPEGRFTIGVPQVLNGMANCMKLLPSIDTNTFGRFHFWIHGPSLAGWGLGSQGCLVLLAEARAAIAARGGGYLEVFR